MSAALSTPSEPSISLQSVQVARIVRAIRRGAWFVVLCAAFGGLAAWFYASSLPKSYTASGALTLQGQTFAIPELQGALHAEATPDPMPWVRSEMQALTSRQLVQSVVNQLHIDQLPEFNASLRPPTLQRRLSGALHSLLPASRATADAPDALREGILDNVFRALVVFNDNRSLVVTIAFTSRDPKLSADFVNLLIQDYIDLRGEATIAANRGAYTALTQRVDQVHAEILALEQKSQQLRDKAGLVGLRAGSVSQQQLEDLSTQVSTAAAERSQLEANVARARGLVRDGNTAALANVLGSETISRLRDQESQASRRVAELSSRYGDAFPGVQSAQADLAASRQQVAGETQRIISSLETQLSVARAHEADAQRQLNEARVAGVRTANSQAQLDELQQEITARRSLYQTLLERSQQAIAQPEKSENPDIRVLSHAVPPGFPSAPKPKLAGLFGFAGGGMLGCILLISRLGGMGGMESTREALEGAGLGVAVSLRRPRKAYGRGSLIEIVGEAPAGEEAEALRLLRTRLRLSQVGSARQAVAFVPVDPRSDANSVAAAFAHVAAADGEQVLLIEGDLPEAGLNTAMQNDGGQLVSVLNGSVEWEDALAEGDEPNLHLLLAGDGVDDSYGLLNGNHFQNLLVDARERYNSVVLVTPSADLSDAQAVAQRVDAVVLVVSEGAASRSEIDEAMARIGSVARQAPSAVLLTAS